MENLQNQESMPKIFNKKIEPAGSTIFLTGADKRT